MPNNLDGHLMFWAKEILGALLILAFFWGLAQVVTALLNRWGRLLTSFSGTELDNRLLQRSIPHFSRLLTVLGMYLAVRSLPLHEKIVMIFSGALFIALVVIVSNLIYHALGELLKWYLGCRQDGADTALTRHMLPIVEKCMWLFLMGAALIVVLKHFNYDIFSLVTALGIGSLAIGMAAKHTLAHMISGFTLMLDRPFRIGDRIQIANGQVGDVVDIGLRSTKIRTLDNMLLIIPNSDLCNTMLVNQAFPDVRVKGRISIGVSYVSDVEQVKSLLVTTALDIAEVLREPLPEAYFVSFGDHSLNMSLFFWVEQYADLMTVTDTLNTLILTRFRENGIVIPFPIKTVRLEQDQSSHHGEGGVRS